MSVPGGGSRNKIERSELLKEYVISMIAEHPDCSASQIYQALEQRFPGWDLPSYGSVRRFAESWKTSNPELLCALSNPDEWKNKYMVAFGSYSAHLEQPNQLWELDSTPGDLYFEDGRWVLVGCIDVWTRRAHYVMSKTSKAEAIAACLRTCLIEWGIPERIKTDNGKDYVSAHITRVVSALGIAHDLCEPFNPQQKPHIERLNKTFAKGLIQLLPEWIGANVTERQAIRSRQSFAEQLLKKNGTVALRCTAEAFAASFLKDWLQAYNRVHQHDAIQMTPLSKAVSYRGPIRRVADIRTLDVLLTLAPDQNGLRTVQKDAIHLMNREYIAPELALHSRQKVAVRYDPDDLTQIYVFDPETANLICIAQEVTALSFADRADIARTARKRQEKAVQGQKSNLKRTAKKVVPRDVGERINRFQAQSADGLIPLPNPVVEATGPWIEGAKQAIAALDATPPHLRQLSEAEQAKRDAFIREEAEAEERKRLKAEAKAQRRQEIEQRSLQVLDDWRNGREPDLVALADVIDFCLEPDSAGWRFVQFNDDYAGERRFQRWLQSQRTKVA